jgi:hypothetical protein
MRSTVIKAVAIVFAALVVAVPTGLAAAMLVGFADPISVVVEGLRILVLWGMWEVVVIAGWLEVAGWREELERPVEVGWVWGAVTIVLSLGLEAEVVAAGSPPLQKLVALCVGLAVVLVLAWATWVAGRPVDHKRGRQNRAAPFQPTWVAEPSLAHTQEGLVGYQSNQPAAWSTARGPGTRYPSF